MKAGRPGALLLAILFLAAGLFTAYRLTAGTPVDSDILSLLPGSQSDPVLAAAIDRATGVAANQVVFAIEGGTPALRQQAADALSKALDATGLFQAASADGKPIWDWLFARRDRLLCAADRARLGAGKGEALFRDALLQWYSPFGAADSRLLQSDPLLLTFRLMSCLFGDRMAGASNPQAVFVAGRITESVFRLDVQDKIAAAVGGWTGTWAPQGLTLTRAGAVFHAIHGAARARLEMSVISGVTFGLILLIYALIFRSLRPPVLGVLLVGMSLAAGLAVTLALFPHLHVMVIVFAAALIGMVVDYMTYYLMTGTGTPQAGVAARRAHLFRPLTLGMATSVAAFAALLVVPILAFRQIAVLGGVGLFAAWLAALYLLPSLEGRPKPAGAVARWLEARPGRWLGADYPAPLRWAAIALALGLGGLAYFHGAVLDDVRQFQSPSAELAAEEAHIRGLTGFTPAGSFFLVTGADRDQATAHEEALLDALHAEGNKIKIMLAASAFAPSQARLAADAGLIHQALIDPFLPQLTAKLGTAESAAYRDIPPPPAEAPLPHPADALRGQTGAVYWSIAPIAGATAEGLLTVREGPWQLVDPAQRYSVLLQQYRLVASGGIAGAVVTTALALLLVYRRFGALRIMLPTVLALILTPSIMSLAGLPVSFFSIMGLFLVIGAGVDYGIFQAEHPGDQGRWTRVGILLAAVMTCTSVGLLGFSSIFPVKSFGVAVALGIVLSLILSPLARKRMS